MKFRLFPLHHPAEAFRSVFIHRIILLFSLFNAMAITPARLHAREDGRIFSGISPEVTLLDPEGEIARSRFVKLASEPLKRVASSSDLENDLEELWLNLFDDVELIAIKNSLEYPELGGVIWNGTVKGEDESVVTLVLQHSLNCCL